MLFKNNLRNSRISWRSNIRLVRFRSERAKGIVESRKPFFKKIHFVDHRSNIRCYWYDVSFNGNGK